MQTTPAQPASPGTDQAAALLRLALGTMWLAHGLLLKVLTYGMEGLAAWLGTVGLVPALAWPLVMAEIVGGVLILLGVGGRFVSLALLPILLGAIGIHAGNGWVFSNPGGGWEFPLFLVVASVVHIMLGDGAWALWRGGKLPVPTVPTSRNAPDATVFR